MNLRTETYKQDFFEQAGIFFLHSSGIYTNELAKRSHMNIQFFFACKNLRLYGILVRIVEILNKDKRI